ncbi:GAF domain-containing protein [Mucilaginibacter sp. Bleaf8]|uniref:GAF domain-containing protein n=1 Tax=Mucilaginibacter sp. Bleaf8 TaxID=2834430 RepID=UPI001BCE21D7|nr:GAF domain-containing protein [Mucilaginibacter sp. Bleaf8]MBS7565177.1 GAF domain-containing protein [Mucilaginibacter sp. Bleaf8]
MRNELDRLDAVDRFKQLDAGIHKDLDDLVKLVAQVCNVPVALVSLIDANMQWFKASVGTGDMDCNQREHSFCQFTIMQDDLLIIPDVTLDQRTASLPIVINSPNIRFYAGVPLITYDGYAIGTLCILDVQTRELDDQQKNTLKVLGKQVLNLIELNWSLQTLANQQEHTEQQKRRIEDSELKLRAVFDSSKDLHFLLSRHKQVLAFNKEAANYIQTNYAHSLRIGDYLLNIVDIRMHERFNQYFNIALSGEPVKAVWLVRPGQVTAGWFEVSFTPVIDNLGNKIGVAFNSADITLQKLNEEYIALQNAALQRIAIIQSHELRRPVASLMGLIEVIRLDNFKITDYFEMLQSTVHELDSKIREIVKESEITIGTDGKEN